MQKHSITVGFDNESNEYIATCSEFPYLSGIDSSEEIAIDILIEAIEMGEELLDTIGGGE